MQRVRGRQRHAGRSRGGALSGRGRLARPATRPRSSTSTTTCRSTSRSRRRSASSKPTGGWKANAYVIFDYFCADRLQVRRHRRLDQQARDRPPQRVRAGTSTRFRPLQLKADTSYELLVAVNGTAVTVDARRASRSRTPSRRASSTARPSALNKGLVGVGSDNSRGTFDNIPSRSLPPRDHARPPGELQRRRRGRLHRRQRRHVVGRRRPLHRHAARRRDRLRAWSTWARTHQLRLVPRAHGDAAHDRPGRRRLRHATRPTDYKFVALDVAHRARRDRPLVPRGGVVDRPSSIARTLLRQHRLHAAADAQGPDDQRRRQRPVRRQLRLQRRSASTATSASPSGAGPARSTRSGSATNDPLRSRTGSTRADHRRAARTVPDPTRARTHRTPRALGPAGGLAHRSTPHLQSSTDPATLRPDAPPFSPCSRRSGDARRSRRRRSPTTGCRTPTDATWTYEWTDSVYNTTPTKEKVTVKDVRRARLHARVDDARAGQRRRRRRRASAPSPSRRRRPGSSTPTGRARRRRRPSRSSAPSSPAATTASRAPTTTSSGGRAARCSRRRC